MSRIPSQPASPREDLSPEARRARELEVRGYYSSPLSFGRRYRFCYLAANSGEVAPDSVRALRPDKEREEPLWAEAVRRGWELYRDVERVSLETKVPLQAVIAILEYLRERGELPVEDRESRI